MKHTEYIIPIGEDAQDYDEMFIGVIRRQPELVRCKDCKYYNPQQHYCEGIGNWFGYDGEWSDNGYCYKAERRKDNG